MNVEFTGKIYYWRGPAPYYFISVPDEQSAQLRAVSKVVTYGWGMIPVVACIGGSEWKTSLFPKDGHYIVPMKNSVRKSENLVEGDEITLQLQVRL